MKLTAEALRKMKGVAPIPMLTAYTAPVARSLEKAGVPVLLVEAGVFMLVLEHIPAALGERVTRAIDVPTIGIGAGAACDGQVLVVNDAMGLGDRWPVFSKQYAYVGRTLVDVAKSFVAEVRDGTFVDNVLELKASRPPNE